MRRADVYEFYRDIHGFKPRHIKWDRLSAEELDEIENELFAISETDWYKQQRQEEYDDLEHELLMYKYEDEDYEKAVDEHPDDFYDTMNFKKDKAKLRDFNPRLESIDRKKITTKTELKKLVVEIVKEQFSPRLKKKNQPPRCSVCGMPDPETDEDGYTDCCLKRLTYFNTYGGNKEYIRAKRYWEENDY